MTSGQVTVLSIEHFY